jgi:hypothetical protein
MSEASTALVIAGLSLAGTLGGYTLTFYLDKKRQDQKKQDDKERSILESKLASERAEKDARTKYEYDAKVNLYNECEPIRFLLLESSEDAIRRIRLIAKTSREGSAADWLSGNGYFMRTTIYRLFIPLAAFKMMQRKLTIVDLKLDTSLNAMYVLSKAVYQSFSDDVNLSKCKPVIKNYAPDYGSGPYQGIYLGWVDNIAESLIEHNDKNIRVKSFGEFEKSFFKKTVTKPMDRAVYLFRAFDPSTRPVLWRILLAQLLLYRAIIKTKDSIPAKDNEIPRILEPLDKTEWPSYQWGKSSPDDLHNHFEAVHEFLKERYGHIWLDVNV